MKYISTLLLIVFLIVVVKSKDEVDSKLQEQEKVISKLNSLSEKHKDFFYLSCFSVNELRPFSILQFKENTDLYSGKWISPKVYLSNLNNKEKEILRSKIAEYILSKDEKFITSIYNKIDAWCNNHKHFELIVDDYGLAKEDLVEILRKFDGFDQMIISQSKTGPDTEEEKSKINLDEALLTAENIISDFSKKQQMMIFSSIYRELSLVASN